MLYISAQLHLHKPVSANGRILQLTPYQNM